MSNGIYVRFKYSDTALPQGSNIVTIFNSVAAGFGGNGLQGAGIHRMMVSIVNSQAGTLKSWFSTAALPSSGTGAGSASDWVQYDSASVAIASANTDNPSDWLIEPFMHWKLEWTNGGSNQTTFIVNVVGTDSRNLAA